MWPTTCLQSTVSTPTKSKDRREWTLHSPKLKVSEILLFSKPQNRWKKKPELSSWFSNIGHVSPDGESGDNSSKWEVVCYLQIVWNEIVTGWKRSKRGRNRIWLLLPTDLVQAVHDSWRVHESDRLQSTEFFQHNVSGFRRGLCRRTLPQPRSNSQVWSYASS